MTDLNEVPCIKFVMSGPLLNRVSSAIMYKGDSGLSVKGSGFSKCVCSPLSVSLLDYILRHLHFPPRVVNLRGLFLL